MVRKYTSALANKVIRQLQEEKKALLNKELNNCTYRAFQNEEPIVPAYDYSEMRQKIAELDMQVRKIKHALNTFNCTKVVPEFDITIDELLVKMAQAEQEKNVLTKLKNNEKVERVQSFASQNTIPEYRYANYDTTKAEEDYTKLVQEIMEMQLALDTVNQTEVFSVEY